MTQQPDKYLESVNQRLLDYYLEIDDDGNFLHPPSTDEELYEFIQIAFKLTLPRKIIEPGHSSPFQFVADCYFERTKNALAFGSRNSGKTYSVAVLNSLDMIFKPGCEIASAGAVKAQAKKAYNYFKDFMDMEWFRKFCQNYEEKTGRKFILKEIQEETSFGNGSKQEILTATEKGLRSPHPHKARIDEVDEIPWSILQTGLSMARTGRNKSGEVIRGQNIFTSTRQHAGGSMQVLLDKAGKDGAIKVYEWNIWEAVQKCERRCFNDPVHGTCPIYAYCKGKAHRCDGFYEIEDFIDKVRLIDREKFETEWENKKPSRNKLVYADFDSNRHVLNPQKLYDMTGFREVPRSWARVSGIDFGASPGHPFVYAKFAQIPTTGAWILFYEYVQETRLMRDHADAIKRSPYWMPNEEVYADSAGKQERMELARKGIKTKPAVKDVAMGIDHIRSLLAGYPPLFTPAFYVWHTCEVAISEFNSYSWPVRADGKPDRSGRPVQENDHVMDASRYAHYSRIHKRVGGYRMRRSNL